MPESNQVRVLKNYDLKNRFGIRSEAYFIKIDESKVLEAKPLSLNPRVAFSAELSEEKLTELLRTLLEKLDSLRGLEEF